MKTGALRKLEGRLACIVRRLQLLEEDMGRGASARRDHQSREPRQTPCV